MARLIMILHLRSWKFWAFMLFVAVTVVLTAVYGSNLQVLRTGVRFIPHGHCFFWEPWVLWPLLLGNGVIWFSYAIISLQIFLVFRKGGKIFNRGLTLWFSAFIFLCSVTHLMSIFNIYYAKYLVEAVVVFFTGVVSFITAVKLHMTRGWIFQVIEEDKTKIDNTLIILETISITKFKNVQELQAEVVAVTERLRQLNVLRLNILRETSKEQP